MKPPFFLIIISLLVFSCKNQSGSEEDYSSTDPNPSDQEEIAIKGKKLMENKCYVCHSPNASQESLIAPPMVAIKARYLEDAKTKEKFIEHIWNFVEKPSKEKAKLKGAVERFGLMPYQPYSKKEIEAISSFMFDYKIEQPEWFQKHWKTNHGKNYVQKGKALEQLPEPELNYADIGMSYAKATKSLLGKNLMGAIQQKGVDHALSFCNVQAMPLTDSMAVKYNAEIKRISDKNRNPSNKANSEELSYLKIFKESIANGNSPEPIVTEDNNKVHFYYPIVTNDMCLKCHGSPGEELKRETYDKILELYPNDKAIGYNTNEVRGIWSIHFEKENEAVVPD